MVRIYSLSLSLAFLSSLLFIFVFYTASVEAGCGWRGKSGNYCHRVCPTGAVVSSLSRVCSCGGGEAYRSCPPVPKPCKGTKKNSCGKFRDGFLNPKDNKCYSTFVGSANKYLNPVDSAGAPSEIGCVKCKLNVGSCTFSGVVENVSGKHSCVDLKGKEISSDLKDYPSCKSVDLCTSQNAESSSSGVFELPPQSEHVLVKTLDVNSKCYYVRNKLTTNDNVLVPLKTNSEIESFKDENSPLSVIDYVSPKTVISSASVIDVELETKDLVTPNYSGFNFPSSGIDVSAYDFVQILGVDKHNGYGFLDIRLNGVDSSTIPVVSGMFSAINMGSHVEDASLIFEIDGNLKLKQRKRIVGRNGNPKVVRVVGIKLKLKAPHSSKDIKVVTKDLLSSGLSNLGTSFINGVDVTDYDLVQIVGFDNIVSLGFKHPLLWGVGADSSLMPVADGTVSAINLSSEGQDAGFSFIIEEKNERLLLRNLTRVKDGPANPRVTRVIGIKFELDGDYSDYDIHVSTKDLITPNYVYGISSLPSKLDASSNDFVQISAFDYHPVVQIGFKDPSLWGVGIDSSTIPIIKGARSAVNVGSIAQDGGYTFLVESNLNLKQHWKFADADRTNPKIVRVLGFSLFAVKQD